MAGIGMNKREESLLGKRRRSEGPHLELFTAPFLKEELETFRSFGAWSNDPNRKFDATNPFHTLLPIEKRIEIDKAIQSAVSRFVEFIKTENSPLLQFEAAWELTNMIPGTSKDTRVAIVDVAAPVFVKFLDSSNDYVCEKAMWALGNVASDYPGIRNLVLGHGVLVPLLHHLNEDASLPMLRLATRALSNFCRGEPKPSFVEVRPALPAFWRLIYSKDEEVLSNTCWALSRLLSCRFACSTNNIIQALIEAGVCQQLVELLLHSCPSVLIPAFRTCSSIAAGNETQFKAVMDAGLIKPLVNLLQSADSEIKKEAAWAISKVAFGVLSEYKIKYFVSQNCMKPLCDLLLFPDEKMVALTLEGLEYILEVGEEEKNKRGGQNKFAKLIDAADGVETIEKKLCDHRCNKISEKAMDILDTYYFMDDFPLYTFGVPSVLKV